ncbi:NUDIX hydrolase [Wenxinia saemankumensis]|uniref:8-oxo-dGTP pyrophosphatase MutT, NUDIX family n=1 Tax=Wenxinia saemankumensis TaxID=1447782 RepID=A0A1M6CU45_9RHOB|nr:NUDIX hydrolase [Wenxinia saemankumensis]SHI64268.1 8-oxo-dGTP pyrophosphatase MutT, NUDIX family [Wenxinia saemankumensis]
MSLSKKIAIQTATEDDPVIQLAALCWRGPKKDREVLLVTSSSGRWILPKGWPMADCTHREAALIEAWEEGGVKRGRAERKHIGSFRAMKELRNGAMIPALVKVFAVEVKKMSKDYPEAERRDRRWVSPKKAASLVTEPGLKAILKDF